MERFNIGDRVAMIGHPKLKATITGRSSKFGFVFYKAEFDELLPEKYAHKTKIIWTTGAELCKIK